MDEALHALILGNAAIAARIGDRAFWGRARQGALSPALVLTMVSGADQPKLEGTDNLYRYVVQIDCYGADRPAARLLSRDVIDLLNGYTGGGFNSVFLGATREGTEDADPNRASRVSLDFNITWRG